MRTIIAGGRDITDYGLLLKAVAACPWKITFVVSGGARGADLLGERWASENKVVSLTYAAQWHDIKRPGAVVKQSSNGILYDAAAGPERNRKMAEDADALLALWDGKSKGTANMIEEARKRKLRVFIYRTDQQEEEDWV